MQGCLVDYNITPDDHFWLDCTVRPFWVMLSLAEYNKVAVNNSPTLEQQKFAS